MVEHSQSAGPAGVAPPVGASIAGKLPEGFAVASNHLFAGRMKQAEAACLELLKAYPNSSKAFQMFGGVLQRTSHGPRKSSRTSITESDEPWLIGGS